MMVTPESVRSLAKATGLTLRHAQVMMLYCLDVPDKQIADYCGIGVRTVVTHIRDVRRKLNCNNRTRLLHYAFAHGLVPAVLDWAALTEETIKELGGMETRRATLPTCKNGHVYTPETTELNKAGWRNCLICRKIGEKKHNDLRQRKKVLARYRILPLA